VPHPHDDGVLLGTWRDFRRVEELEVDAVVSLCRIGIRDHAPAGIAPEDHITVWLLDSEDAEANAHLDFVLSDTAQAIADLRREGKRVLLHCVAAQARTAAVAIRYAALLGVPPREAAAAILEASRPTRGSGLLWTAAQAPIKEEV
jgi:protein-tyrosine phosphatase